MEPSYIIVSLTTGCPMLLTTMPHSVKAWASKNVQISTKVSPDRDQRSHKEINQVFDKYLWEEMFISYNVYIINENGFGTNARIISFEEFERKSQEMDIKKEEFHKGLALSNKLYQLKGNSSIFF